MVTAIRPDFARFLDEFEKQTTERLEEFTRALEKMHSAASQGSSGNVIAVSGSAAQPGRPEPGLRGRRRRPVRSVLSEVNY